MYNDYIMVYCYDGLCLNLLDYLVFFCEFKQSMSLMNVWCEVGSRTGLKVAKETTKKTGEKITNICL